MFTFMAGYDLWDDQETAAAFRLENDRLNNLHACCYMCFVRSVPI